MRLTFTLLVAWYSAVAFVAVLTVGLFGWLLSGDFIFVRIGVMVGLIGAASVVTGGVCAAIDNEI
jgi:hypothetical protein